MRVSVGTVLDATAERVWAELRTTRLLRHVSAPVLAFEPVEPPRLPEIWEEGGYQVRMRLFGIIPMGRQWIAIELSEADGSNGVYRARDNGHGDLVSRWDHRITVAPRADGRCDYRDEVEIEAGLLTPFVWCFASLFYRHRQRRWRRLAASGFDYSR